MDPYQHAEGLRNDLYAMFQRNLDKLHAYKDSFLSRTLVRFGLKVINSDDMSATQDDSRKTIDKKVSSEN